MGRGLRATEVGENGNPQTQKPNGATDVLMKIGILLHKTASVPFILILAILEITYIPA